MTAVVLRGDARSLPLPDASVDLVLTSPPYYSLRDYRDGGGSLAGQIGAEGTPQEYLAALWQCTAEWMRVLKPEGSLFVNLGDAYYSGKGSPGRTTVDLKSPARTSRRLTRSPLDYGLDYPRKSLLALPWRYALGCVDRLGLILRRDIVWHKPNALPESVTDRAKSSHEYLFHLVKQGRYYAAIDQIREGYAPGTAKRYAAGYNERAIDGKRLGVNVKLGGDTYSENPLGKVPGSVWSIPSAPLRVPPELGVDHFAAMPPELARRVILGWSPPGVCTACGQGRRPVSEASAAVASGWAQAQCSGRSWHGDGAVSKRTLGIAAADRKRSVTGYLCGCCTHPKTRFGANAEIEYEVCAECAEERIVYEFRSGSDISEPWPVAPTRPALVVDPFSGTGVVPLVASVYGRAGIGVDLSHDYCRLACWRTADPGERARALDVPKPPKQVDGQEPMFDLAGGIGR